MEPIRLFKKYKNRHIYDKTACCYVDLSELLPFIKEGDDVKIIESTSMDDITYSTILSSLAKCESVPRVSDSLLLRVIRSDSGTFTGYIKELESQLRNI